MHQESGTVSDDYDGVSFKVFPQFVVSQEEYAISSKMFREAKFPSMTRVVNISVIILRYSAVSIP